jgi:mercuric ion transport protein
MANLTALKPLTPYAIALARSAPWLGRLAGVPPGRASAPSKTARRLRHARPPCAAWFFGCAVFIALLLGFPLIASRYFTEDPS